MKDLYITLQGQSDMRSRSRINQPSLDCKLIESWRCAITNILSNVPPRTLRLHLICKTANMEEAKDVLAPFHNFPGLLLEFELCFSGDDFDSPINSTTTARKTIGALVREAASIAQWRDEVDPGKGFRFLDLPLELRRLVYTYTNLATPYRKFMYRPDYAFSVGYVFCECDSSVCLDENTHWNNDVTRCSVLRRVGGMSRPFCKWAHNAYSPRCNCSGLSPVALLQVCRAMHDEALEFLYSYNRLVIHPPGPMWKVMFPGSRDLARDLQSTLKIEGDPGQVQESDTAGQVQTVDWDKPLLLRSDTTWSLLQRIGPGKVRWLRNLEIVFPRIDTTSSLTDADPAYSEWLMAVAMLASSAIQHDDKSQSHRKSLSLTLALHIWTTECYWGMYDPPHRSACTPNDFYERATRLLAPLKALLPYLRRLFVFLEWPEHWSAQKIRSDIATCKITQTQSPGCGIGAIRIAESSPELAEAEMNLEKLVMGPKYDAYIVGKGDEIPSPWVRNLWNGCG
jgi:hypothetical protein